MTDRDFTERDFTERDFADRTVLITGAAGGLGRVLCRSFANAGARIAALDVDPTALAELEQELRAQGAVAAFARADLTDELAVRQAVELLEGELGPISTLICNAGITHLKNFSSDQCADVRRVMEVNFLGSVHCTAACLDSIRHHRGSIIVLSSVAGFAPLVGRTAYCASKHALHGFFDTLRCELRQTGVDILMVCPSYIATGIRRKYETETDRAPQTTAEKGRAGKGRAEKGRVVGTEDSPDSVAEQILKAARARRREIAIGRVGRFSWWCRRLAPRLYERLMQRSIRPEP